MKNVRALVDAIFNYDGLTANDVFVNVLYLEQFLCSHSVRSRCICILYLYYTVQFVRSVGRLVDRNNIFNKSMYKPSQMRKGKTIIDILGKTFQSKSFHFVNYIYFGDVLYGVPH